MSRRVRLRVLRWTLLVGLGLSLMGMGILSDAVFLARPLRADPPPRTSWVGRSQQELIAERGEPASVRIRPDGSLLLEYIEERNGQTCRSVYYADPFGRIGAEKEECRAAGRPSR